MNERNIYPCQAGGRKQRKQGIHTKSGGECGKLYRRVHWNNNGCKSIVWRCINRLEPGTPEVACHNRTVNEAVSRIKELQEFIKEQNAKVTDFDETLVSNLISRITIYPGYCIVQFRSGVAVDITE